MIDMPDNYDFERGVGLEGLFFLLALRSNLGNGHLRRSVTFVGTRNYM